MKKLNFGCGADIREGWDNVDVQYDKRLTKSFDFNKFPYPLKSSTYDYVFAKSVLEHLDKPERVLEELWRVCRKGAIVEIAVPHYSNKGAYDDIQHIHFFNDKTFPNYIKDHRKIRNNDMFMLVEQNITPSIVGGVLPKKLRHYLSFFINGLYSKIWVKLKVIK